MSAEQLICVKCGLRYLLNEHSTPTKCPICTTGISLDLPKVGAVNYKGHVM